MTRILIAEDESSISAFVRRGLESAGYEAVVAEEGDRALEEALRGDVDLVLLDIGLPMMDGFEVLEALRAAGSTVPVIMLTARTSTRDTVAGLEGGANDYVPKPFTFEELLARVRRRLNDSAPRRTYALSRDDVELDLLSRRMTVGGREVELSAREFTLAEQFLRHPGEVLTRDWLLSEVWGMNFDPGSNVVDVYVRYLRGKLGHDRITTVRGVGYRWE
ncbi:response regulator transcription factor [Microbacterium sp.]|uniref:response regulator transcription factor n=1 Tax=Microbacterium sp. TaxID=51671 RepID=UPI003A904312